MRAQLLLPADQVLLLLLLLQSGNLVLHGAIRSVCTATSNVSFSSSNRSSSSSSSSDRNTALPFDVVILATGFHSSYSSWLPQDLLNKAHSDSVLSIGFLNGKALLPLNQIKHEAPIIARHIAP
jgi:hypothetical protein